MGLRRTGESCGVRGYCLDKAGPATCIDSYCFCLEGSVFQNGRCSDPGIDGGISGPSGPSGGAVPGEKDKEEGTPEVTEAVEETTTTPYVEPEDPTKDPDCSDQIAGTECFKKIKWAMSDGIYANPGWYPGLTPQSAPSKFQDTLCRAGEGGCPRPCTGGLPEDPLHFPHSVMTRSMRGIRPPKHPFEYNGIEWPAMKIKGTNTHIFAVGDWGGLAGTLPHNSQIIQYKGGQTMGPHVMGRYRTDAKTHDLSCSTPEMSDCFATNGTDCPARCGWIEDIDTKAQHLVADQMIKRAKMNNPDYLLNVGDNFYWGGIAGKCGETPMSKVNDITRAQFNWIFENVYKGPGLDGKPWLSVLGNHDWGGREMDAAWDQQIAYTWVSNRWVLPAPYWMQKVEYVDQGFTVDIFMIDSNIEDADEDVNSNPEHNICGAAHNPPGSSCAKVGGPSSIHECHNWFQKLWDEGAQWATEKLKQSDAQWQIMVTHFPCGHKVKYYKELHLKYGLDLLVTGHTHYQMMYWAPEKLGGLACFITGGGGGITSENNVELENDNDHQYGFFDLSMSKDEIKIESINWKGNVIHSETVEPYDGTDTKKACSLCGEHVSPQASYLHVEPQTQNSRSQLFNLGLLLPFFWDGNNEWRAIFVGTYFLRLWDLLFWLGGVIDGYRRPLLCFCASSLPSASCHCLLPRFCFSASCRCLLLLLRFCFSALLLCCFSACPLLCFIALLSSFSALHCLFSACSCLCSCFSSS
ncbi:Acp5 [Symbiodinium necroappetens]|uniref:Acp5 protein n=1 Tax=Symbiodinium necroappetens TaxID=1628268 RepID=A0A812JQK6_9DINO|nr:Acp5 [Symbiodinium necroappetens]